MTGAADREYWRRLIHEWTQTEYPGLDDETWRARLTDQRPGREYLMEADERDVVAALPERVRVFRGAVRGVNEAGFSWCLSRDEAVSSAYRNVGLHGDGEPVVVVGAVVREDVIITMHRTEAEVIALPERVQGRRIEAAGPDNREQLSRLREHHIEVQSADEPAQ